MAPTADAGPDLGGVLVTRSLSGTPAVLADVLTAAAEAAPDSAEELLAADASEDMTSAFDAAVGALQDLLLDPGFVAAQEAFFGTARGRLLGAAVADAAPDLEQQLHAEYTALVGARLDEAVNAATPALWGAAGLAAAVQHEHGGEVMPDVAEFLDMLVSPHALCAKLRDT